MSGPSTRSGSRSVETSETKNDDNLQNMTQESNSSGPSRSETPKTKFKRNYRACLNCRLRKVKCDLGSVDNPRDGKCARCLRERKDCTFVKSKRGGSTNVINGKKRRQNGDLSGSESSSPPLITSDPNLPLQNNRVPPALASSQLPKLPPVKNLIDNNDVLSSSRTTQLYAENQELNNGQDNTFNRFNSPPLADKSPDLMPNVALDTTQNSFSNDSQKPNNLSRSATSGNSENNHFSTMEGALVFLANAAGTIAQADERDRIDARKRHEQLEAKLQNEQTEDNEDRRLISEGKQMASSINANDSSFDLPSILSPSAQNIGSSKPPISVASSIPAYIKKTKNKRMRMPALENGELVRPKGTTNLSDIDYIGGPNSILSVAEAEKLINLFFSTMHPFFPYVPKFLHSPKVLSGYPILLCAILTISARYYPFENNASTLGGPHGVPRNIEVHDRLWLYVQRLISQTVWAEASTRSIATVFAFLLFTEWNPRAIHWRWDDYANRADDSLGQGPNNVSDEPTGLGAMRRSYRMSWMLIGSAVRLAQDIGFMEISSNTFLATHIAEINSVMNISRRSMLASSLSEVDLDEDEITQEDLEEGEDDDYKFLSLSEEDLKELSCENILKFTRVQKAKIELLQIISLGHEALYGYKAQLGSLSQRQNLSVLNIISPLINGWKNKYKSFLIPSNSRILRNVNNLQEHLENKSSRISKELGNQVENESFIFEYNYTKLYIYSLALSPSPRVLKDLKYRKINLKLDELSRSAKYIEQAFNAANEMLLVAHRVHKLKLLRFMPIRWLTRIVRAVAFIVKCYLTITAHKSSSATEANINANSSFDTFDSTILSLSLISIDEIVQSIQRAAITLRDCSPDELHLCTRYSNVLMYLCSEMKSKAKNNNYDENFGSSKSSNYNKGGKSIFEDRDERNDQEQDNSKRDYSNYDQQEDTINQNFQHDESSKYASSINHDSSFQFPKSNMNPHFTSLQTQSTQEAEIGPEEENQIKNDSSLDPDLGNPLNSLISDSQVIDWFTNNRNIGLDFVGPWTEMIEQHLNSDVQFNFEDALS